MEEHARGIRLAVIGAGAWGTTLANLLAQKGYRVNLWVHRPELVTRIARERVNALYLPGVQIHPSVTPTADFAEAVYEATRFVSALPSHAVRAVWSALGPMLPARALLISA